MNNFVLTFKRNIVVVLLSWAVMLVNAQAAYTVRDIMSAPYPSELISAKNTDRIAWIFYEEGVRNIYSAAGPEFKPQRLTSFNEDDGQELSNLQISDDGSIIIFVRGGPANRNGIHPNPRSLPDPVMQTAWVVSTDGKTPWKLAVTGNPILSPSGEWIIFSEENNVYIVPVKTNGSDDNYKFPFKFLFNVAGETGSLSWSPDSKKVAFVSNRQDHSFVGIIDRESRNIKWIEPSVERDSNPIWSPDGDHLAFFRRRGRGFYDQPAPSRYGRRGSQEGPFTVWIADVKTGKAKEVWNPGEDEDAPDSIRNFNWVGDHFVFMSQVDEWPHFFSVSVDGGDVKNLTPPGGIIEHFDFSPDGKWIYFDSNLKDRDRRHLWKVPVDGEQKAAILTPGEGIEVYPVALSSNKNLAHIRGKFSQPLSVATVSIDGGNYKVIAPEKLPSKFPLKDLVRPQAVTITAEDGFESFGQLFIPPDAKPGDNRPGIVFVHGGPRRQMLLGWHYKHYYTFTYAFNQYLASQGYLVLSINFRMGIGYGRSFQQAPNTSRSGASEYGDVLAAGRYLQARPEVDSERVGLWGGSYGGYLTALGLARNSDVFAAGVDLNGVHERAGGDKEGVAYDSSPIANIDAWRSPVLLVHGDDDRNVSFSQTVGLYQLLRDRDVHVEMLIYPDEVHEFLLHAHVLEFYELAGDFFDRFLKNNRQTREE